ncbi:Short-chain dehydrogenase protein [Venustampulla echinocandica]|uniref:Short-chain dehydrogenase protein n=1 Tax=Venustampulla echinocandica TaxID=2656787 RepID=A0A370TDR9_9HELO|nr:Short-chain dehydrogenase protein [Venustampulla echinocandica]RDL32606.1 Short-chain dehydrogenase protein [Venustampulla echinocandica]
MDSVKSMLAQFFPPAPTFTDKDVPKQPGRVFIVTGGNKGVGFELVKALYPTGATVYMASRSQERAETAITKITSADPSLASNLKFLHLDLGDLATIKASVAAFTAQESRLDIIWNNAGIGAGPVGAKTEQNIEALIGVNCIGPLLFTQLLFPQLREAAKSAPRGSVRVVWTSSFLAESYSPNGGVDFKLLEQGGGKNPLVDYAASKAGNWFLATETAKRVGDEGIIGVVQNPGNLQTEIYDGQSKLLMLFVNRILYPPIFGAYTGLYAAFSPDITMEKQGAYIIPWGQIHTLPRKDIYDAIEQGQAERFWQWCEDQWKPYI